MVKLTRDPGHGGKDSGAVNDQTGLKEKDVVLKISNSLGWVFDNMCEGVSHNCTRYEDKFVELGNRCNIANRYGADFFASFHVDSADAIGKRFTTYIHPNAPKRTRDISQRLHDEMWNNFYSKFGVFTNGGVLTGDYAVLRDTNMDACLFENGFINNIEHVKLLSQFNEGGFLDQLVMAYARAFSKVFGFKLKENQNNGGNQMTEQNKNNQLSDWAKPAWGWALEKGLVDKTVNPQKVLTTEELIGILMQYHLRADRY
ncbi:N-acetylmuramoyl-L-alanine amidase [Bacillus anthracis]|uniref:N-acetylmuramoyl-L-alanine amidase n=1 Tax=Bacillus anthracis TaxID=1392 RepID=UPI002540575E|nr:N-acetylmuramoyl-L-alanine amidase [Bacillus anthracis]WIG23696.1 N-acetylmuramoyl-L-alanine amidase [Bacillus anthracis]